MSTPVLDAFKLLVRLGEKPSISNVARVSGASFKKVAETLDKNRHCIIFKDGKMSDVDVAAEIKRRKLNALGEGKCYYKLTSPYQRYNYIDYRGEIVTKKQAYIAGYADQHWYIPLSEEPVLIAEGLVEFNSYDVGVVWEE